MDHVITARGDMVEFRLTARNPTAKRSEAHWTQVCPRLGAFAGFAAEGGDLDDYLPKCFVFLDGRLKRMPTRDWATRARYQPGQVWCPPHVPRTDVNPRPLNSLVPSNGLIGCTSADEALVFATAWEPWQELFQGVARCVHADFRLGGVEPGATRTIRGAIYVVRADIPEVAKRIGAGSLVFKGEKPEPFDAAALPMLFSADGVHPLVETGHVLYTDVLARSLEVIERVGPAAEPQAVPEPLRPDHWAERPDKRAILFEHNRPDLEKNPAKYAADSWHVGGLLVFGGVTPAGP